VEYLFVLPLIVVSLLLVFGSLLLSRLLAPHNPGLVKNDIYECGEKTIGPAWVQFNVGYYLFGLIFFFFYVEAAFLFSWATVVRETGLAGLLEVFVFVCILLFGLLYAWRKGLLEWV